MSWSHVSSIANGSQWHTSEVDSMSLSNVCPQISVSYCHERHSTRSLDNSHLFFLQRTQNIAIKKTCHYVGFAVLHWTRQSRYNTATMCDVRYHASVLGLELWCELQQHWRLVCQQCLPCHVCTVGSLWSQISVWFTDTSVPSNNEHPSTCSYRRKGIRNWRCQSNKNNMEPSGQDFSWHRSLWLKSTLYPPSLNF